MTIAIYLTISALTTAAWATIGLLSTRRRERGRVREPMNDGGMAR